MSKQIQIEFENSYADLPAAFYHEIHPEQVVGPTLIAWNEPLANFLGISNDHSEFSNDQLAQLFSGNFIQSSSRPIAMAYSGHQFGHFAPVLGDGRALLLGELWGQDSKLYDIQLKGSGRTSFSRNGDGRSSLGPVLREYLISEFMYTVGIPTTRALAAVGTGELVYRETALPGGVMTRVSESLIRVGTFQYFASRGEHRHLRLLLDYCIQRNYPELIESANVPLDFFKSVIQRQASLIAHWMSLGFIHGVMNTDNFSIAGLTIDYGPCAFMDETNLAKVFSSIDHGGRYAYNNQPGIAHWNLARLAETLIPLFDEPQDQAIEQLTSVLEEFPKQYAQQENQKMQAKLGFFEPDEVGGQLLKQWLTILEKQELDFTLSFRYLPELFEQPDSHPHFFLDKGMIEFMQRWIEKIKQQPLSWNEISKRMLEINPLFIPRNHQVERAINAAYESDFDVFHALLDVLKKPFEEQPEFQEFATAPDPSERVARTFCGT